MSFLISLLSFIVVFSLMVFVHEFGHFSVAKLFGVRVREFGFGFPFGADKPPTERPLTWKIGEDRAGTTYTVNLIPFGGFVNLGENSPEDPGSLANFPKRVRLATLLAGAGMNVLLAFVIFAVAALIGYPEFLYGVGIVQVDEGSPAATAGLLAGDIILRVGDVSLDGFTSDAEAAWGLVEEMVQHVAVQPEQQITMVVQRGLGTEAERMELTVTPRANDQGEGKMGVGIQPTAVRLNRVKASLWQSLKYALDEVLFTVKLTILIPVQILQGLLPASAARPVGPMGIAAMTGEAVRQSLAVDWAYPIFSLVGVLNVAIAITNILPLPAFDGGRIVFILLEAVRGKPIPAEKEGLVHGIGLALMLVVFVAITIQDIFVPLPEGINWTNYLY